MNASTSIKTLAGLLVGLLFAAFTARAQQATPENVILLIADGFGPASVTMTRDYLRAIEGRRELVFDSLQVGSVRTASANSRVTDSAAGATAFSTGHKTDNEVVALDTLGRPLATILEGAEAQGMATGLVVTSRLTHATPASFAAHVENRWRENEIAAQQLTHGIDVLFGGGRRHFLPEADGGRREDGRNLLEEARAQGYQVLASRSEFEQPLETPVLGLFASSHLPFVLDRRPGKVPRLSEMTAKALDLLNDDPDGFFLMVEGSRIDHAGHDNDAAAHLRESLAFEDAFRVALDFARRHPETLIVSVADHETGGLSLGRSGTYSWHPEVLDAVRRSQAAMLRAITRRSRPPAEVLRDYAGIDVLTDEERQRLAEAGSDQNALNVVLRDIISGRAGVGWTTGGHTAVDVNLYAYGSGSERFAGSHENTYIGQTLAELIGLNLSALTADLRSEATMAR